ncbi:hypothetical protein QOZ80_4AG0298760 [Eleusine coracana subsp. coracana]|nr:hypothetical protein QOZ80_4AG0298760 [Eleusine coracana subsp. coracana]
MAAIDDFVLPAQARAYDASRVHDNVRRSLGTVGTMAERVILNRPRKGLSAYLDAVDKLRSVEFCFNSKRSYRISDKVLKHVDELLSEAAAELENDFHRILSKCSKPVELEYLVNFLPNLEQRLPREIISAVQKSVQLGCPQHFRKIYREVRGSTLELNLKYLGVEYVTTEEMQNTHAGSLGAKIADWIQFYQIAIKLFFAAERKLCDQIFEGKHTMKDNCFAEVTAESLSTLLSFGEAVAKSQASPEILFMLLDMYEATFELQSEVEVVFQGYACSIHRKSALNLIRCLALTAKKTFNDFKESILKDSPNSTTADGDVHPLTSYVINYIKFLFDYQSSLKQIFKESGTSGTNSDLGSQILDVAHALETNLEAKSKQYKDQCLAHVFIMNNTRYITRSICSSKLKDLFGDDWVQRRQRIVQQHAVQYRRVSWGKALEFLSAQDLTPFGWIRESNQRTGSIIGIISSITSKSVIKDKFRSFNIQFEEVCQSQMNWVIPDKELRDNLILAIAEILLPAYRSFLKRFGPLIGNSHSSSSKYVKYTPEALEEALGNLFAKKSLIEPGCLFHQES